MKSLVAIYKSPRQEDMYLYLGKGVEPEKTLPAPLLKAFGQPEHIFDLLLTPAKKLARVSAASVLQGITDNGYYLQMPLNEQDDYRITLPDEFLSFNDPT